MNKITYAKDKMKNGGHSLVILADCDTIISDGSGIKPLLETCDVVTDASEIYAADRIVGKAAAMLYVLMGAKGVFAQVLSRPAKELFERSGIEYEYETLTDNIINRSGDGLCPMESAVYDIDDPLTAKQAIIRKIGQLKNDHVISRL